MRRTGAVIAAGVIAVASGHPASAQGDPPSTECQVTESKDTHGMDPKILAEAEDLTRQLCLQDRDDNR